ncbi:malectin domain-containing carbohydrate-binding protein [Salinimicrobium sp. MT39]|uniref:Malectin domain-containing carbohydrate-binding protein n=1 Tax=Salinimicrobium profundisediminis TaxID=2994553 RepID=A0A9X3CW43_9FLAO|nr:glycoside hydrolase family 2 TIM barrel-domain containing protein [Salinimicrobium profundisediminis]MCX2838017.1 malectin domain-containing carbohydrate-binding protein [Salinimicrobium profundisediminis]
MKIFTYLFCFFTFLGTAIAQRQVQSLNSAWRFSSEVQPEKNVNIPHTWNAEDAFKDGKEYFRGKGTYKKTLFAPQKWQNKQVFLKFEGSNQVTEVFVNGTSAGKHIGGYTGFVIDISEELKLASENELKIVVDNSHNTNIPPLDADFNFYGGIYRDLELIIIDKLHFELENAAAGNILVRTPQVSEEKALVQVEARVVNDGEAFRNATVALEILDPNAKKLKTLTKKIRLKAKESKNVIFETSVKNPALWSPQDPQLYSFEISLASGNPSEKLDEFSSKFGFRWFEADPEKGFYLNGKPIKLIGANRHQDLQGLGNALPNTIHKSDYRLIKEMGANFVRTAHYPQDPEVYRTCDELGLIVWSEVPVINDVTATDEYHNVALQMQKEQIQQFFNHPSVIFWGYMNEIFIRLVFNNEMTESEKEDKIETSVALAKKLEKLTKELDPHRLSVMALHENELYNTSGIADIPDVIGWNLYFGWYSPGLENFGKFLDEQHERYPNRPLIISEYGPGADVRIQTEDPKPWDYSEAYQLKLHRSYINQVLARDYVVGMAAWNFADFGSSFRQDAIPYINQKGLLNFDRSKKDIYYYYQARLVDESMIYIAGENYEQKFPKSENHKISIPVFSNAEKVNLSINDSLKISSEVTDGISFFDLKLPEGTHRLTATTGDISHSRTIHVLPRKNLLKKLETQDLTINVGTHVNYKDPVTKEIWMSDQQYEPGGFGYVGGEVYQKSAAKFQGTASDIQGTGNDPLFQTMRESIEAYKFDVEAGTYRVTLLFAEPEFNASEENIYNLNTSEEKKPEGVRSFDVKVNGKIVSEDLNLARDYGRIRAVEISYTVKTEKGIAIEFSENAGKSLLSGIKLEKL